MPDQSRQRCKRRFCLTVGMVSQPFLAGKPLRPPGVVSVLGTAQCAMTGPRCRSRAALTELNQRSIPRPPRMVLGRPVAEQRSGTVVTGLRLVQNTTHLHCKGIRLKWYPTCTPLLAGVCQSFAAFRSCMDLIYLMLSPWSSDS